MNKKISIEQLSKREDELVDRLDELEGFIEMVQNELDNVRYAIGQADLDDLNRQYERSV